jgi:hypothetical protein
MTRPGRVRILLVAGAAVTTVVAAMGLASQSAAAADAAITPGTAWQDTQGHPIQAHGGGMIKVGSTYYWFGEDKTDESDGKSFFLNVPCYSSTDLAHWTFEANVLTKQKSGDLGPNRIIERPKVIYNRSTKQYVMYMHADDGPHTITRSVSPPARRSAARTPTGAASSPRATSASTSACSSTTTAPHTCSVTPAPRA